MASRSRWILEFYFGRKMIWKRSQGVNRKGVSYGTILVLFIPLQLSYDTTYLAVLLLVNDDREIYRFPSHTDYRLSYKWIP